jgi:hypothetical protein
MKKGYARHLWRDFFILVGSVVAAVLLVQLGIIERFLEITAGAQIAAAFLSGMFFTSILTIAPATVALIAVSGAFPAIDVAFWGACGAVAVDFIMFSFVRNDISEDIGKSFKPRFRHRVLSLFHFGFLKWLMVVAGAFIIASPLPDELGLILLGFSRVQIKHLFPLIFVLHFCGIWILITAAGAIL